MKLYEQVCVTLVAWLLAWGAMPQPCHATDYRTDRLEQMAQRLGWTDGADTTQTAVFKGKPLAVLADDDGRITHIGYRLFSQSQREAFGTTVCNFIERYLLELALALPAYGMEPNHGLTPQERMQLDGVSISAKADLIALCADTTVSIHQNIIDARGYRMEWWRNEENVCTFSFPVEYDLLTGVDMDERERRLPLELKRAPVKVSQPADLSAESLRKAWNDNYYTLEGGHYLLENLSGNSYYEKAPDGQLRPIFRRQLPLESLANLLVTGLPEGDYSLHIRLRKYGFKTEMVETTPAQWLRFCLEEGCKPYFGIISLGDEEAVCELIMHCPDKGYNHVLKLNVPLTVIDGRQGTIHARLNAYVTASRIKNLFEDITK